MRILFMGTPDFAACNLQAIADAGHEVVAVVSQPDKPVGRHSELRPTAVKAKALELGITRIFQPERVNDPEFLDAVRTLRPDVAVVTAYGHILGRELLQIPAYGCINVHASLLPRWRGAAPIQWAVIEGDALTGVTAMQMDEGMDTGDILMTKTLVPAADETGGSLFDKLAVLGGELIQEVLAALEHGGSAMRPAEVGNAGAPESGSVETSDEEIRISSRDRLIRRPQGNEGVSYAPMLKKEMGNIDWSWDAARIERLIRGLTPWPGTFTYFRDGMLKIHRAALCGTDTASHVPAEPGTVRVSGGRIFVTCGSGTLELLELQAEGRKRMSAADFLRGRSLDGVFRKERTSDVLVL